MSEKRFYFLLALFVLALVAVFLVVGGAVVAGVSAEGAPPEFPDSPSRELGSAPAVTTGGPHLSGDIVISALDNEQYLPAVAYNTKHDEYLVVWHNTWGGGGRDIYAQRVTSQGELKSWFAVSSGPRGRAQPDVAYDPVNDRYLVVWTYDVFGDGSDWDLWGRFIPWDGPDASLTEFSINLWTSSQWTPKVAYARAQEEFLVVWTNTSTGIPAYVSGRRVFADGSGFPPGDGFTIASHLTENRVNPSVTYNLARNEYLVAYDNAFDIFGVRISGGGTILGSGEFGIAGWPDTEIHPTVAACPAVDQYLVAWQSDQGSSNDAIYARFLKGDGTPGNVYLIDDTTSPEREADVACDTSGRRYMLAWQTRYTNVKYGIWARLVDSDESMDPALGLIPPGPTSDRTNPAVAGGATSYLTVWEHVREGTSYQDIHGRVLTPVILFVPFTVR